MDEIYQNIAKCQPKAYIFLGNENTLTFEVTELWRHDTTGKVKEYLETIDASQVEKWLAQKKRAPGASPTAGTGSPRTNSSDTQPTESESLVLRLVWAPLDLDKRKIELPESSLRRIISKFGLDLAYLYTSTRVTGINAFSPTVTDETERQAYAFTYAPKLAAIWSHDRPKPGSARHAATYGIILATKDNTHNKMKALRKMLTLEWSLCISSHPMFLAFLISLVLSNEIESEQFKMKPTIQGVEARTGHSNFKTQRAKEEPGELGLLSAKMSGYATTLASANRKSQAISRLTEFITQQKAVIQHEVAQEDATRTSTEPPTTTDQTPDANSLMANHVGVVQERLAMQTMDRDYTMKRLQIQIEALVNLIAQTDSMNNMDIALSSHRDASSMKTLAFVTMLFLPGSFISALFSTDCFDWDAAKEDKGESMSVPSTPQFLLYWAITIPLTVLTFIFYFVWLHFSSKKRRRQRHRAAEVSQTLEDNGSDRYSEEDTSGSMILKHGRKFKAEAFKLTDRRRTLNP